MKRPIAGSGKRVPDLSAWLLAIVGISALVSIPGLPVGLSVGLLGHASGPGGSTGPGPGLSGRLSLEGGGDNLRGQVEVVPQVLDTLVGEAPVVMSPGELLLDIAA